MCFKKLRRASLNMSPVERAGPVPGTNFAFGSSEEFQPSFRDKKRLKILGTSSDAKFEKQSKHGKKTIKLSRPP